MLPAAGGWLAGPSREATDLTGGKAALLQRHPGSTYCSISPTVTFGILLLNRTGMLIIIYLNFVFQISSGVPYVFHLI